MKINKEHSSLSDHVFSDLISGRYQKLIQKQVDALPIGREVIVIWSGGNGPHQYRIIGKINGKAQVGINNDVLDFVGDDRPMTVVWLVGHPQGL